MAVSTWVETRRGVEEQETQTVWARGTAPTFTGPAAQGEQPCQIQTSSPESGTPIGPDPSRGPPAWTGNRLTSFPARPPQTVAILRSEPTRRHEPPTPPIAGIILQKPPGDRRLSAPHARSGARPASINALVPRISMRAYLAQYIFEISCFISFCPNLSMVKNHLKNLSSRIRIRIFTKI